MATTEAAHRRIVTELRNPEQQAVVAAPLEGSHLVLAGPGSGKTRVIVHRVAWLLRESMVLPEEIMVLAYNRSAALEVRRRLWALVGADAAGVTVQTLHGLAMRLTGTSYAVAVERGQTIHFDAVIREATLRLTGSEQGDDPGPSVERDRILAGLRFLLVDEYQDINGDHYDLISAVAGRTLKSEADQLSLLVVGDDDQNIYAFGGASVRFIRQFESDYRARRYHLIENYRSTGQIIDCSNRVIARARERMKRDQEIRIDHARRDLAPGGGFAALDPVARGCVHVLEVPCDLGLEVQMALVELTRLNGLGDAGEPGQWGRFAVIARRWDHLEPMAALCRLHNTPVRLLRDEHLPDLHATREGAELLSLLRGERRRAGNNRVLLKARTLSHWFRMRFGLPIDDLVAHPTRAALARFILETESVAPDTERVVSDLVESLYEYGSGDAATGNDLRNGPMVLMTAHRAKGLEFDHVLILDGGGWTQASDEERRLFYVAMTRARKTLTVCERLGAVHPFTGDMGELVVRSKPSGFTAEPRLSHRTWVANPSHVVLSWPGYFAPEAPIHRALARLDVGSPLQLRARADGKDGWELADPQGVAVTRLARKFVPPEGRIIGVRVAAVLVREARQADGEGLRSQRWELVLPEIEYLP